MSPYLHPIPTSYRAFQHTKPYLHLSFSSGASTILPHPRSSAIDPSMASTTSDSLPSSPSIPTTAALDGAADQEFSSSHHHHHHSLFFPSSSTSPASLYLDSSFHGLLPTTSSSTAMSSPSPPPPMPPLPPAPAAPTTTKPAKKRPRASRRPPTTVLTTDTSNFRAMVQEFTGIPASPFAGAATTARSRFDHLLFPLRTGTAAAGTASPATLPQYLLRPFAQKVQVHASSATPYPPSFTSPSASSPAPANISIAPASTTTPGTTTAVASSDSHHQLTAASNSVLLGIQLDHSSSNNYHSFHQSFSLGGDAKYAVHPVFHRSIAPSSSATRLEDPADFLGLTHDVMVGSQGPHEHLHPRNGGGDVDQSGLVGGASVTGAGGCKATYSSTHPLLERNRRNPSAGGSTAMTTRPVAATAGMRTQAGVVDSWVCTSD